MAAVSVLPPDWIPSWHVDGTDVHFPIASLDSDVAAMDATEAGAATGDIRKIMYALMEQIWQQWNDTTGLVGDRPANMVIYRSSSVNETTNVTTKTFNIVFKIAAATSEVAAEA